MPSTGLDFSPCHRVAVSSAVHRLAGVLACRVANFKIALPPLTALHYPGTGTDTGLQVCSLRITNFTGFKDCFAPSHRITVYPLRYWEQRVAGVLMPSTGLDIQLLFCPLSHGCSILCYWEQRVAVPCVCRDRHGVAGVLTAPATDALHSPLPPNAGQLLLHQNATAS